MSLDPLDLHLWSLLGIFKRLLDEFEIGDRARAAVGNFNLAELNARAGDLVIARSAIDRAIELATQSRHLALPQMQAFQQRLQDEG